MKQLLKTFNHSALLLAFVISGGAMAAPSKILFGSCGHQDKDIPIFNAINKEPVSYTHLRAQET